MKQPKLSDLELDAEGTKKIRSDLKRNKKIKITINIEESILNAVKQEANTTGVPYQNLVNKLLEQALLNNKTEVQRLDRLEKEIRALKKKISA